MLTNTITSTTGFNFSAVHPSWQNCLQHALQTLPTVYLKKLYHTTNWLPGVNNIFNAFSMPITEVNYVLFGESPYPRAQSANGYAFWDAAVTNLWSATGLSKPVNRATSLRNIIKMLLIAANELNPLHTSQNDIAQLDKSHLIQTNQELFGNFLKKGFLLLNATPILQPAQVKQDARIWQPFLGQVLGFLLRERQQIEFILLGNIAKQIDSLLTQPGIKKFYAEHPYNISFMHNPAVLDFFRPLEILKPL